MITRDFLYYQFQKKNVTFGLKNVPRDRQRMFDKDINGYRNQKPSFEGQTIY